MHTSITPNGRSIARLMLVRLLALVLAMAAGVTASAQERARDFVSPRLSRTQFQQFLQQLDLGSDQKQIATVAFVDYENALSELATRLDAAAIDAGRQRVDDSLSGKARIAADELQRLRADVLRVYLQAGPEADAALDMLLSVIEVVLVDDQFARFEQALQWLHREILLHPRADASSSQEYAGDGVDVLLLIEQAREAGGELETMDATAFNAILDRYEDELDLVLRSTFSHNRDGALRRKIAIIEKDTDTLKREEAAAVQRWQALYELNDRTVQQIAGVVEAALGEEAAKAFEQRFDRESFAWLFPRTTPDRQIEWLRAREGLSPQTLGEAEAAYSRYVAKRNALSGQAIDMMLKARNEFQTFLYAMMDYASVDERIRTTLHAELLKNSGEQETLKANTIVQIEALLDADTRTALREAMRRPDRPTRAPEPPSR